MKQKLPSADEIKSEFEKTTAGLNKSIAREWDLQEYGVLLIVTMIGLLLPYTRTINNLLPELPPAVTAIISGFLAFLVTYLPFTFVDKKYALSDATLVGLLVAEFAVYGGTIGATALVPLSFFLFMFSYGRDEADHLWPGNKH